VPAAIAVYYSTTKPDFQRVRPHQGRTRWTMRWKPVIDAFAITFSDRWPVAETY
jgi:hypothetical protein